MAENKLKLLIVQSDIIWGEVENNLNHLDELISRNFEVSDVIVLPEMFTTGFSMETKVLAEKADGKAFFWLASKARELNVAITGSIIFSEGENYYNRLYWINPDGNYYHYDKRHLFRMGEENLFFQPGKKRLIVDYKGWRICPLICYDLRFPVWSRNKNDYDLLIYVANWPAARNHVWNILLQARAIENQCFVVGSNRVGKDGNNVHYTGESCVIHPKGYYATKSQGPEEQVLKCVISYDELMAFRKKFPVLDDAD